MAGLQSEIYSAIAITLTVALVALVLRMMARRITKQPLWYDDGFAVVALEFDPYRKSKLENSRLVLWIGSLTYAASIAASKISFLAFYWRLFKFTSIRVPIQVLVITVVIWIIVRTFLTIFQCVPVQANWEDMETIPGAHCPINQSHFFFFSVLVHCVMDLVILALPLFPVTKMRLSWSKKIGVVGLFSSGAVVCVASVFVLKESIQFNQKKDQSTRGTAQNWLWAAVEVNMAIFSGNNDLTPRSDNRSGPSSIGPTRGTADEDYDFDDDDMSDLWPPAPEPALGRGDSRRDDGIVRREGT
ncbi:hypothetical protein ACO1O0_008649 [Amphichorda felina]